ncbi:group II intron reverse transcriptase/maturase [Salmonella enterica]|nr:group II intron reverse transcriptase/maturase [Salmonella enterica]
MTDTLSSGNVSTKQQQIATLARNAPERVFSSLHHYLDYDWLHRAWELTRKNASAGVDGQTAEKYAEHLEQNLQSLLSRIKSGSYRAPAIRRIYIPKNDGQRRPLGLPTFEDKIAQRAVVMVLEPIYEQIFSSCSFGFRPGRSAHQALQYLRNHIMDEGGRWILDIDIRKYFDTINHQHLREFLDRRVTDGVIRKLIDKWLKAGVMDNGVLSFPVAGTQQGGVISPLLSNIYLHYVLDEWFHRQVCPRMAGRCSLTRFADDAVMVFEQYQDCYRVQRVLGCRLQRYGLELHPVKTCRIDFRFKYRKQNRRRGNVVSFNFLGFTHYWRRSRRGNPVVWQQTAKDRLAKTLKSFNQFCRWNRHSPLSEQYKKLNQKLRGHYAYFGITGNDKALRAVQYHVERIWHKWLGRRSRKSKIPWVKFTLFLKRFPLEKARIYHQYNRGAIRQ